MVIIVMTAGHDDLSYYSLVYILISTYDTYPYPTQFLKIYQTASRYDIKTHDAQLHTAAGVLALDESQPPPQQTEMIVW